jgi:hypothetical protein
MNTNETERERLQRIRDAQIKARDPGPSKIRGYDWQKHVARGKQIKAKRQAEQQPFLVELFMLLPNRYRGAIIGALIGGLIPAVLGRLLLSGDWVLLAVMPLIMFGIIGYGSGLVLEPDKDEWS